MANFNTVSTYSSTTALTTATVTDFFVTTNVPSCDAVKSVVQVTMAAETGLITSSNTAASLCIPLFSVRSMKFIPTKIISLFGTTFSFAGIDAATATLGMALGIATTPATLAICGSGQGITPTTNPTAISGLASLVTAGGTGVNVLAANQELITTPALTSTNAMVVVPGNTLYLKLTTGGALTNVNLTCTGSFKFIVCGTDIPA
jgi:hypothetical protein